MAADEDSVWTRAPEDPGTDLDPRPRDVRLTEFARSKYARWQWSYVLFLALGLSVATVWLINADLAGGSSSFSGLAVLTFFPAVFFWWMTTVVGRYVWRRQ